MEKKTHTKYKHAAFGYNLNTIMVSKHISNQKLASKLIVSTSTISGYRTGRRSPSISDLTRLADALQVSLYDLLAEPQIPSDEEETM